MTGAHIVSSHAAARSLWAARVKHSNPFRFAQPFVGD